MIHSVSERKGKPFVTINCAAIPKDLLENENRISSTF
ncbi:sigma 54-interacting transcriptional regulator [Neobacillus sp. NPDC093127]